MNMVKRTESLPRSAEELEELAEYYDAHDTSAEMDDGQWVDPRPMKTTSLRLSADTVAALKVLARSRGVRYTALLREIVEDAVNGTGSVHNDQLAEIKERLARIEAAIASPPATTRRAKPHKHAS